MKKFLLIVPLILVFAAGCNISFAPKTPTSPPTSKGVVEPSPCGGNGSCPNLQNFSAANWKTYTNAVHGYSFEYPSSAKIEDTDSACVFITEVGEADGFALINNNDSGPCDGGTGVGIGDKKITDTITIGGHTYSAQGFMEADQASGYYTFKAQQLLITYGAQSLQKDKYGAPSSPMRADEFNSAVSAIKAILQTLQITGSN